MSLPQPANAANDVAAPGKAKRRPFSLRLFGRLTRALNHDGDSHKDTMLKRPCVVVDLHSQNQTNIAIHGTTTDDI